MAFLHQIGYQTHNTLSSWLYASVVLNCQPTNSTIEYARTFNSAVNVCYE